MRIQCPSCNHSGTVDDAKIPFGLLQAACPRCGATFKFNRAEKRQSLAGKSSVDDHTGLHAPPLPHPAPLSSTSAPPKPVAAPHKTTDGTVDAHSLSFHGKGGELLGIYLVNALLSMVTFNIYYFWGKTKLRRYLWSHTQLMGERFEYLGTGKELIKGAFRAAGLIILIFVVPNLLSAFVHPAFGILIVAGVFVIKPYVLASARRYRYSRTQWHGVRFSFRGAAKEAMKLYLIGTFLSIVTLGFYYPRFYIDKQEFWRTNSFYGTSQFKYTGKSEDLKRHLILGHSLAIITFGVCWFWYRAKLMRYDWEHTSVEGLSFSFDITGGKLFTYYLGNVLIIIFTFGIGFPWVIKRMAEFNCRFLGIKGVVDFEGIRQRINEAGAAGDSLADAMDVDFGF